MDPTLVPGTWFESQFQICVYEHAIYLHKFFFHQLVSEPNQITNYGCSSV